MNRWLNRAANLFLMLLGTACLLRLIQVSFHLTVAPKAYWLLALLCLLLWAAVFLRRGFLPGTAGAVGLLWYLIRHSGEDLAQELTDIALAVRSYWAGTFWSEGGAIAFRPSAQEHTLALLLILFVAVVYLAMVLSGESVRISLSLLLTLPAAVLCLAVNREPPALPLLGLCLFWAELFISGDSYHPNDAAGRAVLLTLLPCLAVLGLSLLFNRPADYVPEDRAQELVRRLEQLGSDLSSAWEKRPRLPEVLRRESDALSGWDRGQDTLDLARPYDFSARAHEVLRFRGSADGSLYLRGRSLGDYTGTGWGRAQEPEGSQALNYAAYAAASASYGYGSVLACDFAIETARPYDTLFLPYFTLSSAPGGTFVPAGGETAYAGRNLVLTDGGFGPLPDSLRLEELSYRAFAREYYTRLPESTRKALLALARQNGLDETNGDILNEVVDFVCRGSVYDLGVRPYPDDDYALYFLQHARRGYCIHYATAACCLYRALGIPARLCEGFLVSARAGAETVVRAADAHAWVEVWLDGLGWIPVETTFGGGTAEDGGSDPSLPENESPEALERPDPTSLPEEQAPGGGEGRAEAAPEGGGSASPEAPEREGEGAPDAGQGSARHDVAEAAPPEAEEPPPTDEAAAERENGPGFFRRHALLLTALAVPAALALAAAGRYLFLRRRLRRWLAEPDGRKRAVYLYRLARGVLRFGGEMPEAILSAAEKASFSRHDISGEELGRALEALNALTAEVGPSLKPLRRLLFRCLTGGLGSK